MFGLIKQIPTWQKLKWLQNLIKPLLMKYIQQNLLDRKTLIFQADTRKKNKFFSLKYEESIYYDQSISSYEVPEIIKEKEGEFSFSIPFVAEIQNVYLIGPHAVGVTKDIKIVLETALAREDCLEKSITATINQGLSLHYLQSASDIKKIDFACSLINCWSDLYAHWMVECLTRIEALEHYYEKTGERPKLIIEKNAPLWKMQSLELMGYSPEDCIEWQGYKAQVNRLVIPSNRREQRRQSIKACRWLGERILSNLDFSKTSDIPLSPKIIISRKKALCRRVINEEELNKNLAKMGFISYVLEDLDFPTQVKIFSQAKIIVAPHGAGFANMIFSNNPIIIELFGQKPSYFFYTLAKGLGFKHGFILCKPQDDDMIVDCRELNDFLNRMIDKEGS